MTDTDKWMREEFEKLIDLPLQRNDLGDYEHLCTFGAWKGYQLGIQKAIEENNKQEPVAFRYKTWRGHWRYVGAPLTKGWDFPALLNHMPLFAAPVMAQGEE